MRRRVAVRGRNFGIVAVGAVAVCTLALALGAQGAETTQLTTRVNPAVLVLTVPQPSIPCGREYNNFPRTMDGFAKWNAISGALRYDVQIDCMDCRQAGKWDSEVGAPFQLNGLTSPNVPHSFQFWGDNKGRWRARGEFPGGTATTRPLPPKPGEWGPWCEFSFKTGQQSPQPLGRPTSAMRCGAELHNFPRVINMHWSMVPGAQFYETEIDCLHCTQVGKWDSEVGTSYHQMVGPPAATSATNASHPFPGDNQGRWRVRAGRAREWGPWSEWCGFSFKTRPPTESEPAVGKATAKIVSVECESGLTVKVNILIDSPTGISSFSVWSTWMGGPSVDQTLIAPLPTHIHRVVGISHSVPDSVDRDHQWGLKVMVPGVAAPIFTYGMEPRGSDGKQRCPGHYRPAA